MGQRDVKEQLASAMAKGRLRYVTGKSHRQAGCFPVETDPLVMRDEGIDTVRCVADEKYMSPRPVSSACTLASVRRVTSSMSSGTLEIGAGEGIRTLDPDLGKALPQRQSSALSVT